MASPNEDDITESEAYNLPSPFRWQEVAVVVLFWLFIAGLILGRMVLTPHHKGQGDVLLAGEGLYIFSQYLVWAFFTPVIFWLVTFLSLDRIKIIKSILAIIALGMVVATLVDWIDHVLWNTLVESRRKRTLSVLYILSNFHFLTDFFVYLAVLMAGFARIYFLRSQAQQQEAIGLRMEAMQLHTHLTEARLQALRMQINPHFLFNTLHVISDHFEENPKAARRMIARLSEILRYSFEQTENKEVSLREELGFLEGYLDIQRFRFEDRLEIQNNIEPAAMDGLVPTLLLQPIVENAIKHGVSQIEGKGQISVVARRDESNLIIEIKDNGPGIQREPAESSGIGLRNTKERLQTLYGNNHSFEMVSPESGGLVVKIVLPYHTKDDHFLSSVD